MFNTARVVNSVSLGSFLVSYMTPNSILGSYMTPSLYTNFYIDLVLRATFLHLKIEQQNTTYNLITKVCNEFRKLVRQLP